MPFTFPEPEEHERLALAGLVRPMVRMDGELTPAEVGAVAQIAKGPGSAGSSPSTVWKKPSP